MFGKEWYLQLGVFRAGLKKACFHAPRGGAPLVLSGMKSVADATAEGESTLRSSGDDGYLDDTKGGPRSFIEKVLPRSIR